VVIGPGGFAGPLFPAIDGRLPKRSTNWPAMEERRLPLAPGDGSGGELRSEDIMGAVCSIGVVGIELVMRSDFVLFKMEFDEKVEGKS